MSNFASTMQVDSVQSAADRLRTIRRSMDDERIEAKSAARAVGRSGSVAAAVGTLNHLESVLTSLADLLEAKAQQLQYESSHLEGPARSLDGEISDAVAALEGELDKAYQDPELVREARLVPTSKEEAIDVLEGVEDPENAAGIFELMSVHVQVGVVEARPDLVSTFVGDLDRWSAPVKAAFLSVTNTTVGTSKIAISGEAKIDLKVWHVNARGQAYAEVTTFSDGSTEVKLAIGAGLGAGKGVDKNGLEANFDLNADVAGYVTVKYGPGKFNGDEFMSGLNESVQHDVDGITGMSALPTNTVEFINKTIDEGDEVVWTGTASVDIGGSAKVEPEVLEKLDGSVVDPEIDMTIAGKLKLQSQISSDGSSSVSGELSGKASANLKLDLNAVQDLGVNVDVSGSAKITFGSDSSGQKYVQADVTFKEGTTASITPVGGSGADVFKVTARVDVENFDDIERVFTDARGVFKDAEVSVTRTTESELEIESPKGEWGPVSYEAKVTSGETSQEWTKVKPSEGEFYDPAVAADKAEDIPVIVVSPRSQRY